MRLSDLLSELRDPSNLRWHATKHPFFRVMTWTWAGMTTVTLLIAITVAVLLHNARFHDYLRRTVEQKASESLGVRVQLEDFTLSFSTLKLDLYGVTVDGASPYSNPPLLQVDHLEAGVRIVSVLKKTWYLDSFRADHPVIHVVIDAHGVSNIPTLKSSGQSNNTSVFDLGIRHTVIDHGELYFNDRSSALAADLHDLQFRASFNGLLKKYSGRVAYSDGHVTYGTFRPVGHSLDAQFEASPATFNLSLGKLSLGKSLVVISAALQNYSDPQVTGHYEATADCKDLGDILREPNVPAGMVRARGNVQFHQVANESTLDSLTVDGDLTSSSLFLRTSTARAQVQQVAAHYQLAGGTVFLRDFHAAVLGGGINAQGTMKNIGGDSHSELTAAVRGVSLASLVGAFGPTAQVREVNVSGRLNADTKASWGKSFENLVAHTDATILGQVQPNHNVLRQASVAVPAGAANGSVSPSAFPFESAIHATYSRSNGQLELENSYARTAQTNLTMNGTISCRSSVKLQMQAKDLREWETIADVFRPITQGQTLQPMGLSGSAMFSGAVQGSTTAPHLTGQLTASDLRYNGTAWKVLRTDVDLSPSMASLQLADLESASRGKITFNASSGLNMWSFTESSPIRIELTASQLDLADLNRLAGQKIPVTGTLSANVALHGSELNPVGSGSVSLGNLTAYDQPIQSAKLSFDGSGNEFHGNLSMQLPAGAVHCNATVRPHDKMYMAELTASGIELGKLQVVRARNLNATGVLELSAKGQGSFDNPQLDATVKIPSLAMQDQTMTGITLQINVADHIANATLQSSAVDTSIQAKAKVNLSGEYLADASLDTQGIPLGPLFAVYAPQANGMSGQTEVHATLHGPLKNGNQLEAHVTLPVLKVKYGNTVELAATSPIHVDYTSGVIHLQPSAIRGTDTDLRFGGTIPTNAAGVMSVMLKGTVNLELAQLFDPDVRSSGQVRFNIDSRGPINGSEFAGEIDVVDANFASGDLPVGLQHGNGVLTLTKDRINIKDFKGNVGGGTVTAQGGVAYRPGIQFDLGLGTQGARILYPQGMRENVDAKLRLSGSTDNAVLGGTVSLTDLSFTQAFDLNDFINQFSGVPAPPSRGFAQNLQLNVAVNSANSVNLTSRTLSIGGTANLQVRGTAANPVLLGRVNLSNGDIILNGNRFVLNGGTIQFVNPSETQPVVNLTLTTLIQQYNINLAFQGPVEQLRTRYSSDPALPEADIINLLAFGQTTEASNANPTPTNQTAESLVASQVSSQVTSRISQVAGISQLSINPVLAGSSTQGPPGANVTIQQRVTGNLFVTFSTNVASTQSQTIQGQYQVSPRVAFSATRDPNGGFAFDTLIKKSW
ncbi:MAG: translocation/assembly module TamB domain-containing protein [Terracidiphilus sp.]|jgi:translocation and assembly module TamB